MNQPSSYFTYFKKIKKIPVPIGILIFFTCLALGVFSIQTSRRYISKASTETAPRELKITNISSDSFTVSWITQNKTAGLVYFGEETSFLGDIAKDLRDEETGNSQEYLTHYFVIDNLKPENKYYFQIFSGQKVYDDGEKPYEVTTAPQKVLPESDIAQGKILTPDNQPANNTIVYLSIANTVMQSALTDSNGNWMIPLSTARTNDLQNLSSYDRKAQIMEIFVQGEIQNANATLSTSSDNPTPDIKLGENYNFLNEVPEALPTSPLTEQGNFSSDSSSSANLGVTPLTITFPSENENVNSQLPEFFGNGPNGQSLEILVESEEIVTAKANTDPKGQWKWAPTQPLSPGEHQITVSYTNSQGFVEKVTRKFVVLAAGESNLPSFTATESAKITSTPKPTAIVVLPSSTATPTASTPTITQTPIPTTSLTSPPTPTTDQTRTTMPSTSSGTFKSGTSLPTVLFAGTGIIALLVGLALVIF